MPKGVYERKSTEFRFWKNVDKNGPVPAHCPELGACWIWTAGGRKKIGRRTPYGKFYLNGRTVPAHRAAFFLTNGRFANPCTLHKCDGGSIGCVRPDHLFEGTDIDNVKDRVSKGRTVVKFGSDHHNSKLTEENIPEIRKMFEGKFTSKEISDKFGVHPRTIRDVVNGTSWRHVS